ncbi:MAG TPA: SDR family oxidoreductase [Pilimelia sp.]|nr:SDR family oxidoreductase [Pilimelia sp.]
MTTKVALVTGANKGIGYEIAARLVATGMTVLVGARDAERGQAAAARLTAARAAGGGGTAVHVPVDVTDAASVAAAAKWIDQEYGRLDILVNNAGILLDLGSKPSETAVETLRRTYETNIFGVVAVTNAMLPLLRQAPAARIVNVSSELGSLAATSDPGHPYSQFPLLAYNSSKSALNAITVSYANELRDTPIKVNAADPGYCATDLNGHSGPRTAAQGANAAVTLATLDAAGPTGGYYSEDGPVAW